MITDHKMTRYERKFMLWLTVGLLAAVLAIDVAVMFWGVPDNMRDMANYILGNLNTGVLAVIIAYLFGSAKSSKDKDDTIANFAKQSPRSTTIVQAPDGTVTTTES